MSSIAQKIIKPKIGLLELAKQLGNVTWSSICTHPVKLLVAYYATVFQIDLD